MSAATTTASVTSAAPTATSASSGGSGPSSPLLFFVALGFGVVFTNLWIIVGVKYCFRYNQRNRQRMNGEDPDAVDLGAMPRQHRRRREKKLMSMDEVNEKFPLTKYKSWRASRADEGLPTAGGINTASRPPTRPASLHDESRDAKDTSEAREAPEPTEKDQYTNNQENPKSPGSKNGLGTRPATPTRAKSTDSDPDSPIVHKVTSNEDDDDDEHIQTAVPAEQLPDPGDACAICIDTIEDDDDVRGLHCGHAFHASCVDPWLTSRRACCPLCKADYYVPKPRPDGANADGLGRTGTNGELPAPPPTAFSIIGSGRPGRRPAMYIPGRFMSIVYHDRDRHGFPVVMQTERQGRSSRTQQSEANGTNIESEEIQREPERTTWRSRITGFRLPRRNRPAASTEQSSGPTASPEIQRTPSQLEAGR
ncbi:hypothetical protein PV10_03113 [Exophiala mesophila]|uniref:RING-type domain-containing protein n=1 Tax=Exophiala mesophila TaxID=212818 RepID=A0A0D1ZNE5_EXOME|nr:uncharacterized protein PV10_03113 [Exophiala mesophila]KIV95459.1 hypothetical protein PV10_03113 [Exophiala mesophila]